MALLLIFWDLHFSAAVAVVAAVQNAAAPGQQEERGELTVEVLEDQGPPMVQMVQMAAPLVKVAVAAELAAAFIAATAKNPESEAKVAMDMLRFMLRGDLNENGLFERG